MTLVATATMDAALLHYNVDDGKDWGKLLLASTSFASPPFPAALVSPSPVPTCPVTPLQNHTEEAATSLP